MRHDEPARTCPGAAGSPAPAASPGPLDAAEAAFRALITGPRPLAVIPGRLAAGLPDRLMPLGELRALLLHPATSPAARNSVWAELVRRARAGDPAWVVGLAGVAMPGLRRASASLSAGWRGDTEDLQAEILAGFLAALRALDLDDLDRVPLASRLCWAAWRAGQRHACASAPAADVRQLARAAAGGQEAVRRLRGQVTHPFCVTPATSSSHGSPARTPTSPGCSQVPPALSSGPASISRSTSSGPGPSPASPPAASLPRQSPS